MDDEQKSKLHIDIADVDTSRPTDARLPVPPSSQGRRIIAKPATKYEVKEVTIVKEPDVPSLFKDALSVVADEIMRFKSKSNQGKSLHLSEARVLQGYIKCLVELSKERRETEDSMDLANMSNDELLKLVEKLKNGPQEADSE